LDARFGWSLSIIQPMKILSLVILPGWILFGVIRLAGKPFLLLSDTDPDGARSSGSIERSLPLDPTMLILILFLLGICAASLKGRKE
jgi:hypothetical protein